MIRVIKALQEQFEADLATLKSWTDDNGPFIDLTPQEQLRRFRDPLSRLTTEQGLRMTQGEAGVQRYNTEMARLDAMERQRKMER